MRKLIWVLLISLTITLVSCNSPETDPEATDPAGLEAATPIIDEANPTAPALATVPPAPTDTPLPDDYPAPTPYPTVTLPEGYPAIPTLPPKYPAGETDVRVWMLRPLGIQCEDPATFLYATVDDAVAALEAEGVEVFEAEMVSLAVTESCESPTSEHFRVLINAQGLDTAINLGWSPEP